MNLSDFNLSHIKENIKNDLFENLINSFLNEIQNFLNAHEQNLNISKNDVSYFTVDRIEENYASLENRLTQEFSNIELNNLPSNISEGQILKYENNEFSIDYKLTSDITNEIMKKTDNIFK